MNNKPIIIEFGFHIIWRIMEIEEGVIRLDLNTLVDLHNSSDDTQSHSTIQPTIDRLPTSVAS